MLSLVWGRYPGWRVCVCVLVSYHSHSVPGTDASSSSSQYWSIRSNAHHTTSAYFKLVIGGWSFYALALCKAISGWVPYWDKNTYGDFYNVAPLRNQAANTITRYPIQSHHPETVLTSPCPILLMLSAGLGRGKHKFDKSSVCNKSLI